MNAYELPLNILNFRFMKAFVGGEHAHWPIKAQQPKTQKLAYWKPVLSTRKETSSTPSIETHLAVVRGLPTKKFECVNEKSSTEHRS